MIEEKVSEEYLSIPALNSIAHKEMITFGGKLLSYFSVLEETLGKLTIDEIDKQDILNAHKHLHSEYIKIHSVAMSLEFEYKKHYGNLIIKFREANK